MIESYADVRARLAQRATNLERWAREEWPDYSPREVRAIVARWAGRSDRQPAGRLTTAVLRSLSAYLGAEVVAGISTPALPPRRPRGQEAA